MNIGVPAKKIWGDNEVLSKFCDVCPNHDFLVLLGQKNCLSFTDEDQISL